MQIKFSNGITVRFQMNEACTEMDELDFEKHKWKRIP